MGSPPCRLEYPSQSGADLGQTLLVLGLSSLPTLGILSSRLPTAMMLSGFVGSRFHTALSFSSTDGVVLWANGVASGDCPGLFLCHVVLVPATACLPHAVLPEVGSCGVSPTEFLLPTPIFPDPDHLHAPNSCLAPR